MGDVTDLTADDDQAVDEKHMSKRARRRAKRKMMESDKFVDLTEKTNQVSLDAQENEVIEAINTFLATKKDWITLELLTRHLKTRFVFNGWKDFVGVRASTFLLSGKVQCVMDIFDGSPHVRR